MKTTLQFILFFAAFAATAQSTQTIRGRIVDEVTQTSLPGVNVSVISTDKIMGAATDVDGFYRIENIPVGSIPLKSPLSVMKSKPCQILL